jgi:hypothetical protein
MKVSGRSPSKFQIQTLPAQLYQASKRDLMYYSEQNSPSHYGTNVEV